MDKTEARERFDRANAHYRAGEYFDALKELDVLAPHFRNDPGVIEARARTLEHLGLHEEALALFNRLVDELGHEKARSRRDRLAEQTAIAGIGFPSSPELQEGKVEVMEPASRRRLRIKPVRLILLFAILAGMYFGYVPYWLGIGLIAAYFVVKWVLRAALYRLFTLPFKMKGKALAGATTQVHGFQWTAPPPSERDEERDEEEERDSRPLRYVWIDVTITPPVRTQGFTHWEPGELALIPSTVKYRSPDDLNKGFHVRKVRFVTDGREEEDEGYKCAGPQRIKILAGVPLDQDTFRFAYYFESFGEIRLRE